MCEDIGVILHSPLYRGVAEGRGVILHSPLYRGVAEGRGVNSLPTCYCDVAPLGLFIPLGRGVPEGRGGILILLMSPRWVCCVCTPSGAECPPSEAEVGWLYT